MIAIPPTMPQGKCFGLVEKPTAHEKSKRRRSGQPWILKKSIVIITLGVMVYGAYVYFGRFCTPMIRRRNDAGAGRGTGIVLVVVFAVLYLWMVWAYVKVVITSPGYAKHNATTSARPLIPPIVPLDESYPPPHNPDGDLELAHRDQYLSQPQSSERGFAGPSYEGEDLTTKNEGVEDIVKPNPGPNTDVESNPPENDTRRPSSSDTRASNGFIPSLPSTTVVFSSSQAKYLPKAQQREALQRRPPTTPSLQPLHRYCLKDEFLKPYRAHHCRTCGTCVLKYDHHCPWIGQCVGARNHKFFVNFSQATIVFTAFSLGTLIPFQVRILNAGGNLDPQKVAATALAGLFFLFTVIILITHVRLILAGTTTVEMLQRDTLEMQENRLLGKFYAWWEFSAKAQKRRQWDKEWGALPTEGNIWWKGSQHAEWVDVMGTSWLGWILPIGQGQSDGLTYPVNPRFDKEGRWRRRADWPEELR